MTDAYERMIAEGRRAFQRSLKATDPNSAKRLADAYKGTLKSLDKAIADLQKKASEKGLTPEEFQKSQALKDLRGEVRRELDAFQRVLREELALTQRRAAGEAAKLASGMIGGFGQPDPRAIASAIDYLDRPAMQNLLGQYGQYHADEIGNIALRGIGTGKNPLETARMISSYLDMMPITDAERFTRTLGNWSLRRGVQESWKQMDGLVRGWTWISARDKHCCMSCIAMHGTVHKLDETLNDHHSGRCTPAPITPSWSEFGFEDGQDFAPGETGQQWFERQPERTQRAMMGSARWMAWQDKAFTFADIPTEYNNEVYGKMRREKSLVEMLGAAEAMKYRRMAARQRRGAA